MSLNPDDDMKDISSWSPSPESKNGKMPKADNLKGGKQFPSGYLSSKSKNLGKRSFDDMKGGAWFTTCRESKNPGKINPINIGEEHDRESEDIDLMAVSSPESQNAVDEGYEANNDEDSDEKVPEEHNKKNWEKFTSQAKKLCSVCNGEILSSGTSVPHHPICGRFFHNNCIKGITHCPVCANSDLAPRN